MDNLFVKAANFQPITTTENGAKAYSTTGSKFVDQFGLAGNYTNRELGAVYDDQQALWESDKEAAIRFPFYLRLITRLVKVSDDYKTECVMTGQGRRDEALKRLLWYADKQPDTFYKNIWLLPVVGSWRDLWVLMYYDKKYDVNCIDRHFIYNVIKQGLESDVHVDLVKKYLPRIKSSSKTISSWTKYTNEFAKEFANFCKLRYSKYNKLKTSGKAHDFQKIICSQQYEKIDWKMIPGRALSMLMKGDFLKKHSLEKSFERWLDTQSTVKFTGYPYELLRNALAVPNGNVIKKHTIDKQFMSLVEKARSNENIDHKVLICLDTSGSMCTQVDGLPGVPCLHIAESLALFFSELTEGAFHHKVMAFDYTSRAVSLPSDSFCENLRNLPRVGSGGTNFQGVIDEIIRIRVAHPEIPIEDYFTTIVAVSDMQFNQPGWRRQESTNFEASVNKLRAYFPDEYVDSLKFVWWNCASRQVTFEGDSNTQGCMFVSGFDGSFLNTLLGMEEKEVVNETTGKVEKVQPTAEDVAYAAINQEIFQYVIV